MFLIDEEYAPPSSQGKLAADQQICHGTDQFRTIKAYGACIICSCTVRVPWLLLVFVYAVFTVEFETG
jgi:hypothetical protein